MFIDSHCHLDFPPFDADRAPILAHCERLKIEKILLPGIEPGQWPALEKLVQQFPALYFSVGLHPWWIDKEKPSCSFDQLQASEPLLRNMLAHPKCLAIGECGLDAIIPTPMTKQREVFLWQLGLAAELDKPVIIHSVKCHNEILSCLNKVKRARGVMHAYSGSYEQAMEFWRRGFYLAAGGTITYPRAKRTRETFARLPDEAILLETDAPDMPLSGRQGEKNSPVYLIEIAQKLAELRNQSRETIGEKSSENFRRLFQSQL